MVDNIGNMGIEATGAFALEGSDISGNPRCCFTRTGVIVFIS
jgi:hypothetical protein